MHRHILPPSLPLRPLLYTSTHCHVLHPPHQAPKRVLLAVEDSPHSDLALAWCLDNALGPQVGHMQDSLTI